MIVDQEQANHIPGSVPLVPQVGLSADELLLTTAQNGVMEHNGR